MQKRAMVLLRQRSPFRFWNSDSAEVVLIFVELQSWRESGKRIHRSELISLLRRWLMPDPLCKWAGFWQIIREGMTLLEPFAGMSIGSRR